MPALRRPPVRFAALLAILLAACSGGTEPEPPVATSVVVRTTAGATSATLVSVGATVGLVARVVDQFGDTMTGQTVTWTSQATAVATVAASGTVTAVANGSAQITATSGSATGSLTVAVAQVVAGVQKQAGGEGTGEVAAARTISVKVVDALGAAIPGAPVTWAVVTGGGTVTGGAADAQGLATATWTPGTTVGGASATATSGGVIATFTGTLTAGPAAQISIQAGNGQTGATNAALAVQPRVRVADQFGNIKAGVTVNWTVTGGGGSVNPTSGATDAAGDAATTWTLGSAGANGLQASAGAGITATFGATAVAPGTPANIAVHVGDNQTALVNFATNVRPAVLVTDAAALPVSGAQVVFTPSAGGSVTGGTTTTNANGVAQVGSWTPGASAGAATLTAAVTGTALTQVFNATAAVAAYNIEIRNIGAAFSPTVQAAFDSAEAMWERVLYGDLSNIDATGANQIPANGCYTGQPAINELIDDVIIHARFDSIDGPGNTLAQAGTCYRRTSNGLAITGLMSFDIADTAIFAAGGALNTVILHEMGHVLGFSTGTWNYSNASVTRACGQNVASAFQDSHFNCTHAGATNNARAVFDSIGGTSYTGGSKVPLENCAAGVPASCGAGTLYSHWREATFDNELMTGYIDAAPNPMSVLTIALFGDNGYTVNYGAAQVYTRAFTAPAASRGTWLDLGGDELRVQAGIIDDRTGRIVRRPVRQ